MDALSDFKHPVYKHAALLELLLEHGDLVERRVE